MTLVEKIFKADYFIIEISDRAEITENCSLVKKIMAQVYAAHPQFINQKMSTF